jgi:hypothetical protein
MTCGLQRFITAVQIITLRRRREETLRELA